MDYGKSYRYAFGTGPAMTPVERATLEGRVDRFLFDRLKNGRDPLHRAMLTPRLSWNRFDLPFKLFYLRALGTAAEAFATRLYDAHILAFSLGRPHEPGNAAKVGLDRFRADFRAIFDSLRRDGFDAERSLVPLARDGSPLNGAHRISAAMTLGQPVAAVETELDPMIFDQRYFRSRGMPEPFLAAAALCAAEVTPGMVVTVTGGARRVAAEKPPFYSQTVRLTPRGLRNIDLQLATQDVTRSATALGITRSHRVRVDQWAANSGIGPDGTGRLFTSRTPKGALALARLLFNANSRHHLNNVALSPDDAVWRLACSAGTELPGAFAFDMGMVLAAYGIRSPDRITFRGNWQPPPGLAAERCAIPHRETDGDILADPRNHFFAFGRRFVTLRLVADALGRQGDMAGTEALSSARRLCEPEPERVADLPQARLRYHRLRAALIAIAFRLGFGERLRRFYRRAQRKIVVPPDL